jgi:hypothetical protein
MRHRASANHPIYQYCRRLALQQKAEDFLREPVTLGGLPARAAGNMQNFHHPTHFQVRSKMLLPTPEV